MNAFLKQLWIGITCCLLSHLNAAAQSNEARSLEQEVYELNNAFHYGQSQKRIYHFIQEHRKVPEDVYWAYIYLSYTYKRLYDYTSTLRYLDSALSYGRKGSDTLFYIHNIVAEKALALFDNQEYDASDSLMRLLSRGHYSYLNNESLAKILTQEAYLLYRNLHYPLAEKKYNEALVKMKKDNPCDLPIVYAKQIELYGKTRERGKMQQAYQNAIDAAHDCNINRYVLYANHMMAEALEDLGHYKEAVFYYKKYDTVQQRYDREAHLNNLVEWNKKYQVEEQKHLLTLNQKELERKNLFIYLILTISLILILFLVFSYFLLRYRKQQKETLLHARYASQLLQNIEMERERIAGELHDGITHELIMLKQNWVKNLTGNEGGQQVDRVINEIRMICRDLHPVTLKKIGLKYTLEHLCERYIEHEQLYVSYEINYHKELPADEELQVYRIIQEALSNVEKHAHAHAARLSIDVAHKTLFLCVEDNGQGFNVQQQLSGADAFGLYSIIERSKSIGGKTLIQSSPLGTSIKIEIPIMS